MDLASAVNIAVPFIASQEGFNPRPYMDAGSYAIGYGNHQYEDGSPVTSDDDPISQARAQELLTFFVNQVASSVQGMLRVDVPDNMLAALTSLGYNWGTGNLQKSILLQLINSGAGADQIAAQWQQTATTSQGQPNSNLVARRVSESQLATQPGEDTLGTVALVLAAAFIILFIIGTTKKG